MKKRLIAIYSTIGHPQYPEDTWKMNAEIKNERDLYSFIIDIHKRDSRNFNDYPLVGGCSRHGFTFEIEKSIIVEDEVFINPIRFISEPPVYFNEAYEKYERLCERMKVTLPNLRKAREKSIQEQNERNLYIELKHKFEN